MSLRRRTAVRRIPSIRLDLGQLLLFVWIADTLFWPLFFGFLRFEFSLSDKMEDIFQWCREGNAMQVRVWLDDTEHDMNQG